MIHFANTPRARPGASFYRLGLPAMVAYQRKSGPAKLRLISIPRYDDVAFSQWRASFTAFGPFSTQSTKTPESQDELQRLVAVCRRKFAGK